MRPLSIIRFEQLFLTSAALGILNQVITFGGIGGPSSAMTAAPLLVAAWVVTLLLWYLVAHHAINAAKWALVVLTTPGVMVAIPSLAPLLESNPRFVVMAAVILLLKIASVIFLFRRDAAEWLRSRGQAGVIDVTTFN